MNQRTRFPLRSLRAMVPGIDHLESRQLLSTIVKPVHGEVLAHHHEALRPHHAAEVGRAHSTHHGKAVPAATPATSTNFQVVAQFSNASFGATVAITDNDIWAVGSSNSTGTNEPLAVHFNGTSWSVVTTSSFTGGASFSAVAAVASNDVWAVGYLGSGLAINPLIEHWDGTSWSVVSSPNLPQGGGFSAVTAISANNVWAVGGRGDVDALVEHWDGTSWSIVTNSVLSGVLASAVSADSSNDIWALANHPAVALHFDGTSWSRVSTPQFRQGFSVLGGVTALSPTNVWAVGEVKVNNRCCPAGGIEHWDGTKFSLVPSPDPKPGATVYLSGIAAISASDIWAVGFAIEQWNGTSWSIIASPAVGQLQGVTALSDGTVTAVSNQGYILQN
jgi:hypothetical protein